MQRFQLRAVEADYRDKLLSAMRFQFGGRIWKSPKENKTSVHEVEFIADFADWYSIRGRALMPAPERSIGSLYGSLLRLNVW